MNIEYSQDRLLKQCRAGDEDAWHQLVKRYTNFVRAVPARMGLPESASADVVQETFLALYRNLDSLQAAEALPKWLATTATRLAYRHQAKRRQTVTLEDAQEVPTENPSTVLADLDERNEMRQAIEKALDTLPDESANIVRMLYIEGLSYAEVSARTGRPSGSIGPTRMRSLAKLREILQKEQYAWAS